MSDKQYQPLFDYLRNECGVLVLPNGKNDIVEIVRKIADAQPPAAKGADNWVDVADRQPNKDGIYKVQRAHGGGLIESAEYFRKLGWSNQQGYRVIKWLDESPTAAGEVEKELELARSHFKLKAEQVGYWSQAYNVLKAALLKLRKGANSADLAIIDEALNREIQATADGDGKEAMDFEFVEWIQMSPYSLIRGMGWIQFHFPDRYYTTAELYDIFKQQK